MISINLLTKWLQEVNVTPRTSLISIRNHKELFRQTSVFEHGSEIDVMEADEDNDVENDW